MTVAYVVPRYGPDVVGGAEHAARMLAERLARRPGWSVEVFTTGAVDSATWAPHHPPGDATLDGVLVHRFAHEPRHPGFPALCDQVLRAPEAATPEQERRWVRWQGPESPDLVAGVAGSDADLVAFYPYLFHPTVAGIGQVGGRAVLHPAAHDEPPLRLPLFRPVFTGARALVFHTDAERRLVEARFPVAAHRQLVLGLGVEEQAGEAGAFRAAHGLGDAPYLVCVGRVDSSKGTTALARLFAAYKERNPGPLRLVLLGPVAQAPPPHPEVVLTGSVDEAAKWGALRGATALVSPSRYESFSLVLMEAWLAGAPVLVNAACEVTADHVRRSGGGAVVDGYVAFEAAVEVLLRDPPGRRAMAARGAAYVDRHYRWPGVIERYTRFLERTAAALPVG